MKLLLLVTLLTGATAQSIGPPAVWHWANMFECNISSNGAIPEQRFYGCFCGLWGIGHSDEALGSCCRTRDNCLAQVHKLENCAVLMINPYTSYYSFSCAWNKITCTDKNNPCEALICNCDREAGICISKVVSGLGC